MPQYRALALALLALAAARPALALDCQLLSIRAPDFANLRQHSPQIATAEGSITVECDAGSEGSSGQAVRPPLALSVQISLALSAGQSGSYVARQAFNGPRYNLYLDSGLQRVWGDGSGGSSPLQEHLELISASAISSRQRWVFPVFAAVEAQIDAASGMRFQDNVLVTLDYR